MQGLAKTSNRSHQAVRARRSLEDAVLDSGAARGARTIIISHQKRDVIVEPLCSTLGWRVSGKRGGDEMVKDAHGNRG